MDKYFINDDDKSAEKYPEIKVMKNIEDMRVAYYCYYGKNPEDGAFRVIKKWVLENKLNINNGGYRIFGYNAPDSDASAEEYGYEVCVTIPADMTVEDGLIKTKILNGGLYAIVSIDAGENLGEAIIDGWKRFSKWLDGSRYIYGKSQWLEEHLGFDNEFEHCGGIDLYMPVMPKTDLDKLELFEEDIKPFTAATYVAKGRNAENKARKYLFDWAQKQSIDFSDENVRVFATYDNKLIGSPSFWYKLLITVSCETKAADNNIVIENFSGGSYLRREVKYRINAQSWYNFIQTVINSKKYDFAGHPFLEEYLISKPNISEDTDIAQHMPITLK